MTDDTDQDATEDLTPLEEQEYPTVDELELDDARRELLDPEPVRHAMIQADSAGSGAGGQAP